MTLRPLMLLGLLPVLFAESAAYWWMHPRDPSSTSPVLKLSPPAGTSWQVRSDLYREVQPSLHCNQGWIANAESDNPPGTRLAYFEWDRASTVNTLEAFKHLPEQCMGSIGMDLEKVYPRRRLESGGFSLIFDVTLFRPHGGGRSVHIFKCVWVSGLDNTDLRGDVLLGNTGNELRQLRLSAAITRFKPSHTRVIMVSVAGMPSEKLAWREASAALSENLEWSVESNARD